MDTMCRDMGQVGDVHLGSVWFAVWFAVVLSASWVQFGKTVSRDSISSA